MANPAVFNYGVFQARFPELGSVPEDVAQMFFDEAGVYFKNDGTSLVKNDNFQAMIMNLVTAHLIKLAYPQGYSIPSATPGSGPTGPNGLIGRISSASEGSVSVSAEVGGGGMQRGEAFWAQTQYGWQFWNMTRGLRSARYRARPTFIPSGGPFPGDIFGNR